MSTPIDLTALKERQKVAWASGDYAVIGTTLQIVGESLAEACDLRCDEEVLDVAAGNGNATLAAARITAEVKVVFTKLPDAPAAGSIQSTTAPGTRIGSHINQVIRAHSETSVVSMMHLVQPPTATEEETCGQYIDELSALTQQLPLCMLVSTGQRKSVITTAI